MKRDPIAIGLTMAIAVLMTILMVCVGYVAKVIINDSTMKPVTYTHCHVTITDTPYVWSGKIKMAKPRAITSCGIFETNSHYNGMITGHTYTIVTNNYGNVGTATEES